ncbi:MAG: esterase family protein [Lentisphaeria bacterium]|nr:esterase family protein [Lentisphaeria bacterium]
MAFAQMQWRSEVLGKQVGMAVILPDVGVPPFPVFYLLHGLSDDYTIWHRRTRIEWYVRDLPLIVVMPDGFRGFYTDNAQGPDYATYMAVELPALVQRFLPARTDRGGRCIGGLSMGGYGALRLALGYPERYVSANSHSGALLFGHRNPDPQDARAPEFLRITGPNPAGSTHDLLTLARRCGERGMLPALRIDCGTEDFLLPANREFLAFLKAEGIAHEYAEFPGAHTWDYWDTHVQEALAFHCRHLGIIPAAPPA